MVALSRASEMWARLLAAPLRLMVCSAGDVCGGAGSIGSGRSRSSSVWIFAVRFASLRLSIPLCWTGGSKNWSWGLSSVVLVPGSLVTCASSGDGC